MQVMVHYPESEELQIALKRKTAEVHAEYLINYIKKIKLSDEDLKKLIEMISDKTDQICYKIEKTE